MAKEFPVIGVRAVVENVAGYVRDLGIISAATRYAQNNLKQLAGGQNSIVSALDEGKKGWKDWVVSVNGAVQGGAKFLATSDEVGSNVQELAKKVQLLPGSIGALSKSFAEGGSGSQQLLSSVKLLSMGSGDLAKRFSETTPQIAKMFDATNRGLPSLKSLSDGSKGAAELVGSLMKTVREAGSTAIPGLVEGFKSLGSAIAPLSPNVGGLVVALGPLVPIILGAVAAVVALGAAVNLAFRGAAFEGIESAFNNLASGAGLLGDALVSDLSKAAGHTISEMELMKNTNLALAGATGELRDKILTNLPQILEISRAQAAATGQSVDHLFQSLITGIKRSSPLLIDNTGLVLKVGAANEAYAKSVGKSVEELTEQEKQIAILNATVEAGSRAIEAQGGILDTASSKLARIQASVKDGLDAIALGLQPTFKTVLDFIYPFVQVFESIGKAVGAALRIFGELFVFVAGQFVGIFQVLGNVLSFAIDVIAQFLNFIGDILHSINMWITNTVTKVFGKFQVDWTDIWTTALQVVYLASFGIGKLMGALVSGFVWAGAQILGVVASIAEGIAAFLVGHSPPPEGPLSEIDKGGENTMLAWLDGFAKVSLDPIKSVAAEVQGMMGNIATMSQSQVESRLAALDRALKPFSDRLEIVKARFEAINEPAKAALDAIDRQMDKAAVALNQGVEGSDAIVRQLDVQKAALQSIIDKRQEEVDKAQIQFSIAKALQAEERTMLELRKKGFAVVDKVTKKQQSAVTKATGATGGSTGPKGGSGGGGDIAAPGAGGTDSGAGKGATPANQLLSTMGEGFQDGFGSALDQGDADLLIENTERIGSAWDSIQGVNLGDRIGEMFSGMGDTLNEKLVQPVQAAVDRAVNWFTDTEEEGTLAHGVSQIVSNLGTWVGDIGGEIDRVVVQPTREALSTLGAFFTDTETEGTFAYSLAQAGKWFTDTEDETTLAYAIANLPTRIGEWLEALPQTLMDNLTIPMLEAKDALWNFLFNPSDENSLAYKISNFFTGQGEGTLGSFLAGGAAAFLDFATVSVPNALRSIGLGVWTNLAVPIVNILNWVIERLNNFITGFNNIIGGAADVLSQVGINVPGGLGTIPVISTDAPSWLTGGATGGVFSGGSMVVGERGPEIMTSSSKMAVFPNNFVTAIDALSNVLVDTFSVSNPVFAQMAGGGNTSNSSTVMNNNFPKASDSQDAVRRMTMMGLFK